MRFLRCDNCQSDLLRVFVDCHIEQINTVGRSLSHTGYSERRSSLQWVSDGTINLTTTVTSIDPRYVVKCCHCQSVLNLGKYGWEIDRSGNIVNIDDKMEELL